MVSQKSMVVKGGENEHYRRTFGPVKRILEQEV